MVTFIGCTELPYNTIIAGLRLLFFFVGGEGLERGVLGFLHDHLSKTALKVKV